MRKVSLFLVSIFVLTVFLSATSLSFAQTDTVPELQINQFAQATQPPAIPAGRGGSEEHPKLVEVQADNSLMAVIAVTVFLAPVIIYAFTRSRRKQQASKINVKK